MVLDQLLAYFGTSPAIKLLRAQNAPFVLDFLYQHFKAGQITIPASELSAALAGYCERIHEVYPEVLREKPEQYLLAWCSGENRWLQRFTDRGHNEPLYQLTPHTEDVFVFLDRAFQRDVGFVGTESRLRLVISTLADLVAGASPDPEVRIAHLREERRRLDEEIDRILADGVASRFEPAVVRDRFATAVALLRELLADFRAVEDRFKEITRQVQQRQSEGLQTRGKILGDALDAEDVLKRDDQGVSFQEFYRFIASPERQERLQRLIAEVSRIKEIAQQREILAPVRRLVPSLLAEAEKVMRTTQRLSATLRRLLDVHSASDRQRVTRVIAEIRALAARVAGHAPIGGIEISVEAGVEISLPFSRTFWSPAAAFDKPSGPLHEHWADSDRRLQAFRQLALLHRLDWGTMRNRVEKIAEREGTASLRQIVEEFPPDAGVVELLGYLQIACDDGHVVSRIHTEEITLPPRGPMDQARRITVPLITFLPPEGRGAHVIDASA